MCNSMWRASSGSGVTRSLKNPHGCGSPSSVAAITAMVAADLLHSAMAGRTATMMKLRHDVAIKYRGLPSQKQIGQIYQVTHRWRLRSAEGAFGALDHRPGGRWSKIIVLIVGLTNKQFCQPARIYVTPDSIQAHRLWASPDRPVKHYRRQMKIKPVTPAADVQSTRLNLLIGARSLIVFIAGLGCGDLRQPPQTA